MATGLFRPAISRKLLYTAGERFLFCGHRNRSKNPETRLSGISGFVRTRFRCLRRQTRPPHRQRPFHSPNGKNPDKTGGSNQVPCLPHSDPVLADTETSAPDIPAQQRSGQSSTLRNFHGRLPPVLSSTHSALSCRNVKRSFTQTGPRRTSTTLPASSGKNSSARSPSRPKTTKDANPSRPPASCTRTPLSNTRIQASCTILNVYPAAARQPCPSLSPPIRPSVPPETAHEATSPDNTTTDSQPAFIPIPLSCPSFTHRNTSCRPKTPAHPAEPSPAAFGHHTAHHLRNTP